MARKKRESATPDKPAVPDEQAVPDKTAAPVEIDPVQQLVDKIVATRGCGPNIARKIHDAMTDDERQELFAAENGHQVLTAIHPAQARIEQAMQPENDHDT